MRCIYCAAWESQFKHVLNGMSFFFGTRHYFVHCRGFAWLDILGRGRPDCLRSGPIRLMELGMRALFSGRRFFLGLSDILGWGRPSSLRSVPIRLMELGVRAFSAGRRLFSVDWTRPADDESLNFLSFGSHHRLLGPFRPQPFLVYLGPIGLPTSRTALWGSPRFC